MHLLCKGLLIAGLIPVTGWAHTHDQPSTTDAISHTPGGVAFTIPRGWRELCVKDGAVLETSADGSYVSISDGSGADEDQAVANAWRGMDMRPRPLWFSTQVPPGDGWESSREYDYETSPAERRVVKSIVLETNGIFAIVLINVDSSAYEKQTAAIDIILKSIHPKGYVAGHWSRTIPHRLNGARIASLEPVS